MSPREKVVRVVRMDGRVEEFIRRCIPPSLFMMKELEEGGYEDEVSLVCESRSLQVGKHPK